MKRVSTLVVAALITFSIVSSSYAIAGLGLHYGLDFSMSMDKGRDDVKIPGAGFDLGSYFNGFDPGDIIKKDAPFIYISRSELKRSALNFGGKAFVDIIPFIDMVELSFNLGVWQYEGSISYLDVKGISDALAADPALALSGMELPYKELPLTLKEYGMNYFGLNGTPYAKLHFDASVRKTVLNLWLVKFNAGAGMSMHFATPILNSNLIDKVKVDKGIDSPEELVARFMDTNSGMGKAVVEKILDELFTPRFGAHIVAGARLKLPAVPIGIYVDGKLMIPISKFDENKQINGLGFLVNTGLSLSF